MVHLQLQLQVLGTIYKEVHHSYSLKKDRHDDDGDDDDHARRVYDIWRLLIGQVVAKYEN